MFKKVFFTLIVLGLVFHQSIFLYALHNGIAEQFLNTWNGFGIIQTEYSVFLFKHFKWFWAFPIISIVLMSITLFYFKKLSSILTAFIVVLFDVLIYWSAYSPDLMVKL